VTSLLVVEPARELLDAGGQRDARVGIRPVTGTQDRITRMAVEQRFVATTPRDRSAAPIGRRIAPMRSDELISNRAKRNDNVDSAPWFLLIRST
jgi:hypothetical protein